MTEGDLSELKKKLKLEIPEEELQRAFLHSSFVNENSSELESNERLEFLGDAVLDLAISDHLFRHDFRSEGELTKIKSIVVSGPTLAKRARALGLQRYLFLGKGEAEGGGRERSSILSDAFEALVGIIFLQKGYEFAAQFVLRELQEEIDKALQGEHRFDYKTLLQEEAQRRGARPVYTLMEARGADHQKEFTVRVELEGEVAVGCGRRVKAAEQEAARQLYERLRSSKITS
jgi:ribonuclease-3